MGIKERRVENLRNRKRTEREKFSDQVLELEHSRELFIKVFKDESPFVNLGYGHRQIQFTLPVIRLLEEPGIVEIDSNTNTPFLRFNDPEQAAAAQVTIGKLPDEAGFNLVADRIDALKFTGGMTPEEKLMRTIFIPNAIRVFDFPNLEIAQITLFNKGRDTNDLRFLVRNLADGYTDAVGGFRNESSIAGIGRALGVNATFKAAWIDDFTKRDLVVKLDTPEDKDSGSLYMIYRRLTQVEDEKGEMAVFGRKPNASKETVMDVLNAKKSKVFAGNFALDGI